MIFSIVIAVLILGIAYFHWVQGLLSGLISVVLAVLAASLAVGYHETVVANILGGKMADSANGMMLCLIFALVYGIGRIAFDSLIPGNVRLPLYLDAVGGGICGVIVGIFATGTLSLAMQSMPFGPSILYYSRYPLADDKEVTVNGERRQESAMIVGALDIAGDKNVPDESTAVPAGILVSPDSMLTDFVSFQSESGSMAGGVKLRDRHPNLLRELFLQRVGIENSAKRTALNDIGARKDVAIGGLYAPSIALLQMDGENPSLNRGRNLPKTIKTDPNKVTLVVRITVAKGATDADGHFRFSTGSIRLVADGKDFTPVGVLYEPGRVNLLMNYRADDFLVAKMDDKTGDVTIDLVFIENKTDLLEGKDTLKIKSGAFLEVKRLARIDLNDKPVQESAPEAPAGTGMVFKKETLEGIKKQMGGGGAS